MPLAHRAGIVHRDLKPGNVMLTSMGAKLLDFRPRQDGRRAKQERWRPDGDQILFNSDPGGQGIDQHNTEVGREAAALSVLEHTQWPDAWAPDASVIASTEVSLRRTVTSGF